MRRVVSVGMSLVMMSGVWMVGQGSAALAASSPAPSTLTSADSAVSKLVSNSKSLSSTPDVRAVSSGRVSKNGREVTARVAWSRSLAAKRGVHRSVVRVVVMNRDKSAMVVSSHVRNRVPKSVENVRIRLSSSRARLVRQAQRVVVSSTQTWGQKRSGASPRFSRALVGIKVVKGSSLGRTCGSRTIRPGANLSGCTLVGAYLAQMNLTRVNFSRAKLQGAIFTESKVSGMKLAGSDVTRAKLNKLIGRPASLPAGWIFDHGQVRPRPRPAPSPVSSQTVTFGEAPEISVGSKGTVVATVTDPVSGGGALSFVSLTTGACTVVANSGVVTGLSAGTNNCVIRAVAAKTARWGEGTATQTLSINPQGSIDTSFATGIGFDSYVHSTANQSDGKILVGGNFTTYKGETVNHLVRLDGDGSLDSSFETGSGFNGLVYSVVVLSDGKILVGGNFTTYKGETVNHLVRLNDDGSLDSSFETGSGFNGLVDSVAEQSDGKILVGGTFTSYRDTSAHRLVRLDSDGSLDSTFVTGSGFNDSIYSVMVLSSGKVLVGGNFTTYNGTSVNRLVRLNGDGSLDTSFVTGSGFDNYVYSIAELSGGKILVGGYFTAYNGTDVRRLVRLNG